MSRVQHARRVVLVLLGVLAVLGLAGTAVYAAAAVKTPGFTVSGSPSSRTVSQGQSTTYSVTVSPTNGFTGSVVLSVTGSPDGATSSFSPASVNVTNNKAVTATLTVSTVSTVKDGNYSLQVTGTSGSVSSSTKEQLVVNGFSLSASPSTLTVEAGSTATYAVAISRNNFKSNVALSVTGLPDGVSAAFSPNPTNGGASTLSIRATAASPGTSTLTIHGSAGGIEQTTEVQLTIPGSTGSFALGAAPASATVLSGSATSYNVTINRTNFAGAVTLSASGLPGGATASFSPNATTGGTSTMTITTGSSTQPGTSTIAVTGSASDAATQTASVSLIVTDQGTPFTITGSPVGQLSPGVSQPLDLTLNNPNDQQLQVASINVTIAPSSFTSACTSDNYAVIPFSGTYPLNVPAGQSVSLSSLGVPTAQMPKVSMVETGTNQDACKGLPLTLNYSGNGQG